MKSIIKGIAAVAACAMTVTGLAACGSSSASGEKKLDFITGMATGSVHLKTLQSITDAFEKENPGVKINLIPSSQDFTQDIKVRLAARNAPDLWNTHGWSRDRYADFLEPLQNRSWAGKMKDLTKEAFMEDDGTFYALPLDIQVTGVLYNKDVLDKVGVDPNSLNTWDEFNDACAKVKEAGLTCVVAGGKDTAIAGDLADLTASAWYDDAELKNLQSGKFDSSVYEKESGLIEGWKNNGYFNKAFRCLVWVSGSGGGAGRVVWGVWIPRRCSPPPCNCLTRGGCRAWSSVTRRTADGNCISRSGSRRVRGSPARNRGAARPRVRCMTRGSACGGI